MFCHRFAAFQNTYVLQLLSFYPTEAIFQLTFTCSKSTTETIEKAVKHVQGFNNENTRTKSLTSFKWLCRKSRTLLRKTPMISLNFSYFYVASQWRLFIGLISNWNPMSHFAILPLYKGSSIKYVRKIFWKTTISYPLITSECVRIVGWETLACRKMFAFALNRWWLTI